MLFFKVGLTPDPELSGNQIKDFFCNLHFMVIFNFDFFPSEILTILKKLN